MNPTSGSNEKLETETENYITQLFRAMDADNSNDVSKVFPAPAAATESVWNMKYVLVHHYSH